MTRSIKIWLPQAHRAPGGLAALADAVRARGGARALPGWHLDHPDCRVAYCHGERHSLWWEFPLLDSFRWQGHLARLRPAAVRQRTQRLASHFGLTGLLGRPVDELSAAQRAAADLAVALLPKPELLVWEEPLLSETVAGQLHDLCRTEGVTVLLVSARRLPATGLLRGAAAYA